MAQPNILWITLDSVRADHTTLAGYDRETTPTLQTIADNGYGFTNCFSHGKSTLPSSGAILTGYAPTRTTLGITGDALPESVDTVAERFQNVGYTTACLSRNSYLSSATGLDRGFDRFQWLASSTIHEAGFKTIARYLLNIKSHSAGFQLDTAKHASPFLMNGIAKRWLADFANSTEPTFFYLHYNEPHRPYYPPGKYLDKFSTHLPMDPHEAAEFALEVHYDLDEIVANGCNFTDDEWAVLKAMYDAEIAYTDSMVGNLLAYLETIDMEETIVVLTSDHGELFGEHGLLSHSYVLDDAVTHVPLAIRGLDDDLVVEEADFIQHSDVMTTLLNEAGADATDTIGKDLRESTRDFVISQKGPDDFEEILRHNPNFDLDRFHQSTLTALRTSDWKYQQSDQRSELFHLPDETADVSDDNPDVVESLNETLSAWIEDYGKPVGESREGEFSSAAKRQLRELGYID